MIKNIFISIITAVFISSCTSENEKINLQFNNYTLSIDSCRRIELPQKLLEASGLAFYNGTLFSHNDEQGIIFSINADNGNIISEYQLNSKIITKDFEGIAAGGNNIYLTTSGGEIFIWNMNDDLSLYRSLETGLSKENNIEGLCFDNKTNSLLIACKDSPGVGYENFRAIYSFDLQTEKLNPQPKFLLSIEDIKTKLNIDDFSPSGLEMSSGGNMFIISSRDKAIIEINNAGAILNYALLPDYHDQPEGITFSDSGELIICDEGKYGAPMLTIYPPNK